ncbi:SIR2 family protein [Vreelandella sp. H-I2]
MSNKDRFLKDFSRAVSDDAAAVFVGAGVSMGAGYPSWKELLQEIGDELEVNTNDVYDLAALAQWSVSNSVGRTRINTVIRDHIDIDHPIPDVLHSLARLPIRNIWTTNYDKLIERSYSEINRPVDAISTTDQLALRPKPGAVRLFKMHGSIDNIEQVVISTDDYELYKLKRGAFLPLLHAHMSSFSMLFMGLSFTDPNIKHVLSLIRENFADSPPEHFAIVRPPQKNDYEYENEFNARLTQHKYWAKDLKRYGLLVVEIDDYSEIDGIMYQIERRVASQRIWISGSCPTNDFDNEKQKYISQVSSEIGTELGKKGLSLVTGFGLTVGSASMAGFLQALQKKGIWDLERRLIARPFPQPLLGSEPNRSQWTMLRKEMARLSGVVIVIGGMKLEDGQIVIATGVIEEIQLAKEQDAFILPIGSTGGAAEKIAKTLIEDRSYPHIPSKADLKELLKDITPNAIAIKIIDILNKKGFLGQK